MLFKFVSDSFTSAVEIWYLVAPGAEVFGTPCALSSRVVSLPESITLSVTARPTVYEGVLVYLSKIKLPAGTWINVPDIK